MPIQTSPSISVVEHDYTQVVSFAPSGEGAIAGKFTTGPIMVPVMISTVADLESVFGTPTDDNYREWFSAYNFLQYSSKLWVVRIEAAGVLNAADTAAIKILNQDDYELKTSAELLAAGNFVCKHAGSIGNNLEVFVVDSGNWAAFDTDTYLSEGRRISAYISGGAPSTTSTVFDKYGYAALDEVHVVVIDKTGKITGVPGRILEIHQGLSKAQDVIDYRGKNIYYADFINNYSNWVYWASHTTDVTTVVGDHSWGDSATTLTDAKPFDVTTGVIDLTLVLGADGTLAWGTTLNAALTAAYDMFLDKDGIAVSFLITVNYPVPIQKYIIQSIAEPRRDCIAFVSPHDEGEPYMEKTTLLTDLLFFRNTTLNINSSYAVLDSGFKYQFDGYNQKWRWVPLNGDTAGLCARLDVQFESWQSPAGFNRGTVKNVSKLSSVLNQAARDQLYPKGVNAVVSFAGKGTVLFGDRTMQSKSSAFQYIHIRRLFIILEKAIEDAAKYALFELNTETTRNNFVSMVGGFLQSVKARDGLDDFSVVCDKTNNTDDTIARGEFIADIYIKPLYSVQFIVLNFVAVKSAVQFNILTK